jgi:hypothetical protein
MAIQEQIAAELRRRADLLPDVIADWKQQTNQNVATMGIHQSQIRTVARMFADFESRLNALASQLAPGKADAMPAAEFGRIRLEFEQELTGSHSILATLRYIFAQRYDSLDMKSILDAVDLIAAACYVPCMALANAWRNRPAEEFREPPLVYLNARLSPAAITRRHAFGLIGLELYGSLEQQLPISIVSLSFHDVAAVWSFCSIYHEVGHLLDQDIGLSADLKTVLADTLGATPTTDVWVDWWLAEIVADVFGVLLGGAGFALALMSMLFKLDELVTGSTTDVHPSPYVRMLLIAELLKRMDVDPLARVATEIEATWTGVYGRPSDKWKPFAADCSRVADTLLTKRLTSLGGEHALLDFASHPDAADNAADRKTDHKRVLDLEPYLRTGVGAPPAGTFPRRLVPAAAQLAVHNVTANHEQVYEGIQQRTRAFLAAIPHKTFLAGDSGKRDQFVQDRIARIDFSRLQLDSPRPPVN